VNAPASSDQIAAKLYLHAVLPALEDLGQVSARARALIANWNCGVEFAVFNGGGAAVQFNHGAVSVSPVRSLDAGISLFFLSANQLVKQFDGQGFSLPLPRRGLWRIGSLRRFIQVSHVLEAELEQHPRLLLGVALASLPILAEHDSHSRELLRECPAGIMELNIPMRDLFGWAEWRDGKISCGRGRSPRPADVTVTFHDEPAALAALRGELDEMAATGRGDLIVRGLIPLAETLGLVMARAEEYIERRTKT
jgi:hypothetical protein